MENISNIPPEHVALPLAARTKADAIAELVHLLHRQGQFAHVEPVLKAVLDREAQRSTGLGRGFALPHAKSDAVGRIALAFGRPAEPIDFDSTDGQPVDLIALLLSPVSATAEHIASLARLNRIALNADLRGRLARAANAEEFVQAIREASANR